MIAKLTARKISTSTAGPRGTSRISRMGEWSAVWRRLRRNLVGLGSSTSPVGDKEHSLECRWRPGRQRQREKRPETFSIDTEGVQWRQFRSRKRLRRCQQKGEERGSWRRAAGKRKGAGECVIGQHARLDKIAAGRERGSSFSGGREGRVGSNEAQSAQQRYRE